MAVHRLAAAILVAVLAAAPAAWSADAPKPPPVSKFLEPADFDPALILPPPPAEGSALAAEELGELHRLEAARTPERLAQARHDSEVEDVTAIADVLGPAFDLQRFPATAKLFADLRNEDSAAAKRAKAYFQRTRPWAVDDSLQSCDREDAPKSSYPSGHATMGYAAAILLADLIPGNGQVILARAADYAQSRLVCGVHYRGDIVAGQTLGTALVLRLMQKPAFKAEVEAARAELTAAHIAP
jgi:acid phosphatase (class A)